jgi:hypothetical protein
MLVLKLERWPQGDERRKESLGTVTIANDCTGTDENGNYEVTLRLPSSDPAFASVEGFPRGPSPRLAWQLVTAALRKLLG